MKDKIIAKALKDADFRKRLVKDPAAALKDFGVKVPAGIKIKVLEDTADTVHLVLLPTVSSGAISDAELAGVAGGGSPDTLPCRLPNGGQAQSTAPLKPTWPQTMYCNC